MAKKPKEEIEQSSGPSASDRLLSFLKDNNEDHYNFEDEIYYKVSTGSLNLDILQEGLSEKAELEKSLMEGANPGFGDGSPPCFFVG